MAVVYQEFARQDFLVEDNARSLTKCFVRIGLHLDRLRLYLQTLS
jgi:hypothetical protein